MIVDKYMEMLRNYVLFKLGFVLVKNIKLVEVINIFCFIEVKGSLEIVKCLCRVINEIMIFVFNSGKIENNFIVYIFKNFIILMFKKMVMISFICLLELM